MNGHQTGMLQSLPQQQSGVTDMQLLQQQAMWRKMQELQRQQQIQQLEARQQNLPNQKPSARKQEPSSHSCALLNGTPISPSTEVLCYPWPTDPTAGNTSWLQQTTSTIQESSNGFRPSSEQDQASILMGLVPQQVDQSLYGVPISNTRGNHGYSHIPLDRPLKQQMTLYGNSFPGNESNRFPGQVNMEDGSVVFRQGYQGENSFDHLSSQGLNSGLNLRVNSLLRNSPVQDFHERQELARPLESLQENTVVQNSSSQNVVALDPTEEKILFGDDNIWDAFGSSAIVGVGQLNGTGISDGFTSVQSGTWSALMQSAVAETSSSDVGLQEEWSGLSIRNTEVPAGNRQPSTYQDKVKQPTLFADNKLQTASQLISGSVSLSDDTNFDKSYHGISEFQHAGQEFSYNKHGGRLQTDSNSRSIQQSVEEESKWLSRGPRQKLHAEGTQICGNAGQSSDAEINPKSISGSWVLQQNNSSSNFGQPQNKPNGGSIGETVFLNGDALSKFQGNENKLLKLHGNDQRKVMYEEMSHGVHIWKTASVTNSAVELKHVKSATESSRVNREDSSLNDLAAIPDSSAVRASQETSQLLPNSHHLNYWRDADSSMISKGSKNAERFQHHLNKGPQFSELSINSSDKEPVKMHDTEICDRKENSRGSYRSNLSQHTANGGGRENIGSDGRDSQNLAGGKQKLSGQAGRRTPAPRKFQYHPMGNLDEDAEPSYAAKHATHSRMMLQQFPRAPYSHNQGFLGQSSFFDRFPKASIEMEKGHSPDDRGNRKGVDVTARGTIPGFTPNSSSPSDSSVGKYVTNKAAQSSQNMLELLPKVDESKEHENLDEFVGVSQQNRSSASQGFGLQLAPPLQRLPIQNHALASQSSERTDGSLGPCHTTPEIMEKGHTCLASTGKAQSLPSSDDASQGKFKMNKINNSDHTGKEHSLYSIQGNFSASSASGLLHLGSRIENQQKITASGEVTANQFTNRSFERDGPHSQRTGDGVRTALSGQSKPSSLSDSAGSIPHGKLVQSGDGCQPIDTYCSQDGSSDSQVALGQTVASSQTFIASGIARELESANMVPNSGKEVSAQQHLSGTQSKNFPPSIFQPSQTNDNAVYNSYIPQDREDHGVQNRGNTPSEVGLNSMASQGFVCGERQLAKESTYQLVLSGNPDLPGKMGAFPGKEYVVKNSYDASSLDSASSWRDVEAFGRSLKPSNFLHQNDSLLHQMRAVKTTEIDSSRGLKRLKEVDGGLDSQMPMKAGQAGEQSFTAGDISGDHGVVPSEGSKMLIFSGSVNNSERSASPEHGNVPSQGIPPVRQRDSVNYPCTNDTACLRDENSRISPQMAPSWFNQFGTFKNGLMLPMHDKQKSAFIKTLEQPFMLGSSADSLHAHNFSEQFLAAAYSNESSNVCKRPAPTSVMLEHLSSAHSLSDNVANQGLAIMRPKKRKIATSELLPWQKAVTLVSQSIQTISKGEVDWAKAANLLIEKVEKEAEMVDFQLRSKTRLILTTQLMQLLFRPPCAAVLSSDASLNYEAVVFMVARLGLGDACSVILCPGIGSSGLVDSLNLLSYEHDTLERTGDLCLSKVTGDFIARARKLESDFMRLDKGASIVDVRIESQDIDKISLMNRFAKFHFRGQADGAKTSSSSDAPANAQRPCPRRNITAIPMPRSLPDMVQCLSL